MDDRDFDQINVIPLVDVMLVLLVIVLTTATFIATGEVPVDLAEARQVEQPSLETPLILSLKADGTLYLGKTQIFLDGLGETLAPYPKSKQVVISADSAIVLEKFVRVVDEVKRNGFPRVSLQVEHTGPGA
ncbi:biopolymer transport protein ExbD [Methylomagnum ishizawai]|uniref:Biopolymer transport protein ExbD n=1 Tax=Methylomagnum ishizawai TaxID=1760988 RepID=A0A1Y6D9M2_9GAMM|nr:biopolymer transporter ExbD [Methylomagnum ishizawai]SMF97082.1 biopolymer transport protein ExbD [Methylomagnum ishizawai]